MPIRNPFAKKTGPDAAEDGLREPAQAQPRPSFEKVDTVGSKSSARSFRSERSEPMEYKMSVVNDSGVYLPPSPPEKKGFWSRKSNPSGSTNSYDNEKEIEPFSISRESFDSYRRSFDISAKSPVLSYEIGRQSLDSARMARLPRSAIGERRFDKQPPTAEEGFEDVGLNDDQSKHPKKKGFFSKFGDSSDSNSQPSSGSRFHITGRKRGQSGTGEELGVIPSSSGFHIPGRKRGQSGAGEELGNTQSLAVSGKSAEVEGAH
ncbi:hypothetical protein F5884DRAFT_752899 [Xylogone sp. PMI_703]|nr:hypothetical protein F5884DRAFT_752899 [Xylogone sp. PMI_703]